METKPTLNNDIYNNLSSWYVMNPVYATQSSTVSLGGSQTQIFFNIPANVYNLNKTKIAWDASLATAAYTAGNIVAKRLSLFDYIYQIIIYDQSTGFILQDIKNLDTLSKMQQLYVNPLNNRDSTRGFLYKSVRTNQTLATANTSDPYFQVTNAGAHLNALSRGGTAINNDFKANGLYSTIVAADNNGAILQLPSIQEELCNIVNDSIFSLKKDLYLQNIVVKIVLNQISKILTNCAAGYGEATVLSAFDGAAINLTNFRLIMFMQGDNSLNVAIKEKALLGTQTFIIPELVDNMVTISTSANHTINITFSSKFQRSKLYKYYHFICTSSAGNTQLNNFSLATDITQVDVYYQNTKIKTIQNSATTTSTSCNGLFKDILSMYKTNNYYNYDDFNNDSFISHVFDSEKVECDDLMEWNKNKWTGIEFVGSNSLQFQCILAGNYTKNHFIFVVLQSLLFQTNGVFHA